GINQVAGHDVLFPLYPNPANTNVSLSYQLPPNEIRGTLRLYSTIGQVIRSRDISSNKGTIEEDVTALLGGIYYYTLSVNGVVMATNKLAIIR
ncbi:MAG TPA: T9SS type A sorting domain-containing protein, partial [Bacteroidia bacterium]|nr:T9SS type A sorting domain-containing protein [Bacteroidia bacterium]